VRIPQSSVFHYPNLVPGQYTVGFQNDTNSQGINFSFVRLTIDAFRIYKAESSSATPLLWGANGQGGDGIWDVNATANWRDITGTVKWLDFGANDHAADFAGKGGTVRVAAPVRVNRLAFRSDLYELLGQSLELTGDKPMIYIADGAKAVLALPVRMPDGTSLAVGTYTSTSHPQLVTGGGVLSVEAPR
jgi:hypothetical protein